MNANDHIHDANQCVNGHDGGGHDHDAGGGGHDHDDDVLFFLPYFFGAYYYCFYCLKQILVFLKEKRLSLLDIPFLMIQTFYSIFKKTPIQVRERKTSRT